MDEQPIPKKSLGQHWLTDEAALQAVLRAAEVSAGDVVLEIGPGLGTLTALLTAVAGRVIAVEVDEKLADDLAGRVEADNLQIVRQDILRFDLTGLPADYKIVANIPYYLTSHLMRVLSETPNRPLTAALLVQKEVAERLSAKPGGLSLLGITAQYYWRVSRGRVVPAELFEPPPKVDSQVVVLRRRNRPLFADVDSVHFFRIIKAGFAQKRKTVLNSLGSGLHLSRKDTETLLRRAGIAPTARAQALSLEDWHKLYLCMLERQD